MIWMYGWRCPVPIPAGSGGCIGGAPGRGGTARQGQIYSEVAGPGPSTLGQAEGVGISAGPEAARGCAQSA